MTKRQGKSGTIDVKGSMRAVRLPRISKIPKLFGAVDEASLEGGLLPISGDLREPVAQLVVLMCSALRYISC